MRAILQRVTAASVTVDGVMIGEIGKGLAILLGVGRGDGDEAARKLADKVAALRIFADDASKFNRSALDVRAEMLVVSQFTLYADTRKGRRPSFVEAAPPEIAERLVNVFVDCLRDHGFRVATGKFQAHMLVNIFNDGPVTISLEV